MDRRRRAPTAVRPGPRRRRPHPSPLAAGAVAVLLAFAACGGEPPRSDRTPVRQPAAELRALWSEAEEYGAFLDGVDRRRDGWLANSRRARPRSDLLDRLAGAGGPWRILAVAEDWCGDSVHTLPYLAALAHDAPNVELRVIGSEAGRSVMEAHPTPDGRAATPTFVLMDAEGRDRGCLVERPPALQEWFLTARDSLSERELYDRKYAWYESDGGEATMEEIVRVVEAAARDQWRCGAGGSGPAGGGP